MNHSELGLFVHGSVPASQEPFLSSVAVSGASSSTACYQASQELTWSSQVGIWHPSTIKTWDLLIETRYNQTLTCWSFQPLWTVLVIRDDYSKCMEKQRKTHIPNHQPVESWSAMRRKSPLDLAESGHPFTHRQAQASAAADMTHTYKTKCVSQTDRLLFIAYIGCVCRWNPQSTLFFGFRTCRHVLCEFLRIEATKPTCRVYQTSAPCPTPCPTVDPQGAVEKLSQSQQQESEVQKQQSGMEPWLHSGWSERGYWLILIDM